MKLFLVTLIVTAVAQAKIKTEVVDYKSGDAVLQGALVYDEAKSKNKKPGVVIVHNWMGVGDYVQMRAEQMAGLGYVAFVADIYGKGVRPKTVAEAQAESGKYKNNRKEVRARANAAYETLKASKLVNPDKISAMGYCFGGMVALELARMGLPLKGAVSFHGSLAAAAPGDATGIKTKLLILHGAIDPYVKVEEVQQFQKELNDAGINYEFTAYSGAVHAFTEKEAGTDISKGAAYNEQADKRSFLAMQNFLTEVNRQ